MAITDRILGYWSGSDTSDASGNGHTLTANGTSPAYVTGKVGNAFDCDNTNSVYWSIAPGSAGDLVMGTRSQSWSFWFNINALPGSTTRILSFGGNQSSGLDPGFGVLLTSSGTLLFRFSDGSSWVGFTASGTYSTGTWYHCRVVIDRKSKMRGFVNGSDVGSIDISTYSATTITPTVDFQIGGTWTSYYDGLVDEVMCWDGVMPRDVSNMHRNGGHGKSYAKFAAYDGPFVAQEWYYEQETNTTHGELTVSQIAAGNHLVAYLATDGAITSPAVTAWESAWTAVDDAQSATAVGLHIWTREITTTDASTETEVRVDWTTNEKAVLIVQEWDGTDGVDVASVETSGSASTSHTVTNQTATLNGGRLVSGIAIDGGSTVSSSGYAGLDYEEYQVTNSAGHVGLWIGIRELPYAGDTGTYTYTISGSVNACPFILVMAPTVEKTELERYYFDGDAYAVDLTALAAQLGGTGSRTGFPLVITEANLPDLFLDADGSAPAVADEIRAGSSDGSVMYPVHVQTLTLDNDPANSIVEIWINTGTVDATNGQDVTLFWLAPGRVAPKVGEETGQYNVYNDAFAYWYHAEDDPTNGWTDSTRNQRASTALGSMTSGDEVAAVVHNGGDFDGTDDGIQMASPSWPAAGTDFTIGRWAKPSSKSGFPSMGAMPQSDTGSFQGMFFDVDNANQHFRFVVFDTTQTNNASAISTTTLAFATNFYFVVGRFDDSLFEAEIFVDGASEHASAGGGTRFTATGNEYIGSGRFGATNTAFFLGILDEPWRFDGYIADEEILTLYNNQVAPASFWSTGTEYQPSVSDTRTVSGSVTQGGQTFSGTAAALVQASGTLTQGAATAAGTAEVLVQVSGSVTQGGAVLAGTVGTPSIDVSGSLTQGAATLSGSAAVLVQASGSLTQGAATLTGTAAVVVSLSGSLTQGGAVISGAIEDPNNIIADIELSAAPLFNVALAAAPGFNIALSAAPKAS